MCWSMGPDAARTHQISLCMCLRELFRFPDELSVLLSVSSNYCSYFKVSSTCSFPKLFTSAVCMYSKKTWALNNGFPSIAPMLPSWIWIIMRVGSNRRTWLGKDGGGEYGVRQAASRHFYFKMRPWVEQTAGGRGITLMADPAWRIKAGRGDTRFYFLPPPSLPPTASSQRRRINPTNVWLFT